MILEGYPVAQKIYQELARKIGRSKPCLAIILIGENKVSESYIQEKKEVVQKLGLSFKLYHLPAIVPEKNVRGLIADLNQNKFVTGIVVQLPLPQDFDTAKILKLINPQKDIDGFSGKYPAPTAAAILEFLKYYKIEIQNKNIVIVGHGRLVGKPLEEILLKRGLKPIICDSKTQDIEEKTLNADIIISATGIAGIIKAEMVSKKAIVIDAGTSETAGRIVGDVDSEVYKKVSSYSPVPGGVGPVTVAMLMKNLVEAAKK